VRLRSPAKKIGLRRRQHGGGTGEAQPMGRWLRAAVTCIWARVVLTAKRGCAAGGSDEGGGLVLGKEYAARGAHTREREMGNVTPRSWNTYLVAYSNFSIVFFF